MINGWIILFAGGKSLFCPHDKLPASRIKINQRSDCGKLAPIFSLTQIGLRPNKSDKILTSFLNFWFIPKLVGQILYESLRRARKERQLAPQALYRSGAGQASAGYPLSINSLPAIRKGQRGREKKASEN
jgi:hypothetical protein